MKASELIKKLQELFDKHGDLIIIESFSGYERTVDKVYYEFDDEYIDEPEAIVLS